MKKEQQNFDAEKWAEENSLRLAKSYKRENPDVQLTIEELKFEFFKRITNALKRFKKK